jgi:uncharacterized membrane protein
MKRRGQKTERLWEIDSVRGIAVILMIFFHIMWDLSYFGVYGGSMLTRPWQIFARSIGSTFIFLLGLSMTLKYSRLQPKLDRKRLFGQYLLRGVILFGWGLVVTTVTYLVLGNGFVVFGILHLLGLSTILAYPFLRSRWASLVGTLVILALGSYIGDLRSTSPWLLWLGVQQIGRHSVDYYPIIPWFGFALLGVFSGLSFYAGGVRGYQLPDLSNAAPIRALRFLGRHSLAIYLIHQPVILGILIVAGVGSI